MASSEDFQSIYELYKEKMHRMKLTPPRIQP